MMLSPSGTPFTGKQFLWASIWQIEMNKTKERVPSLLVAIAEISPENQLNCRLGKLAVGIFKDGRLQSLKLHANKLREVKYYNLTGSNVSLNYPKLGYSNPLSYEVALSVFKDTKDEDEYLECAREVCAEKRSTCVIL